MFSVKIFFLSPFPNTLSDHSPPDNPFHDNSLPGNFFSNMNFNVQYFLVLCEIRYCNLEHK
jgi:hypothetical protein